VDDVQVQATTFDKALPLQQQLATQGGGDGGDNVGVTFYTWLEQCEPALRQYRAAVANRTAASSAADRGLLASLADAQAQISLARVGFFSSTRQGVTAIDAENAGMGRRLLAPGGKGSSGAGKGRNFQYTDQVGSVAAQGWSMDDVAVASAPINGPLLPSRMIGRANELVGGLLVHQVRSELCTPGPATRRCIAVRRCWLVTLPDCKVR
jgi:hypothetical protein